MNILECIPELLTEEILKYCDYSTQYTLALVNKNINKLLPISPDYIEHKVKKHQDIFSEYYVKKLKTFTTCDKYGQHNMNSREINDIRCSVALMIHDFKSETNIKIYKKDPINGRTAIDHRVIGKLGIHVYIPFLLSCASSYQ